MSTFSINTLTTLLGVYPAMPDTRFHAFLIVHPIPHWFCYFNYSSFIDVFIGRLSKQQLRWCVQRRQIIRSLLSLGSVCTGIPAESVQPNQQPGNNTLHTYLHQLGDREGVARAVVTRRWLSGSFRQLQHTHRSSTDQTAAWKGLLMPARVDPVYNMWQLVATRLSTWQTVMML